MVVPPTAMLQLTFLTIETTTLKEKVVGFAAFPIFINAETGQPVVKGKGNLRGLEMVLHEGNYQLPIYSE